MAQFEAVPRPENAGAPDLDRSPVRQFSFIEWIKPGISAPAAEVGGKGAGLLRLSDVPGVRVPEGFILRSAAFHTQAAELALGDDLQSLQLALKNWSGTLAAEAIQTAASLRRRILESALAGGIAAELSEAFELLRSQCPAESRFIARSSEPLYEDSAVTASAGKNESVYPLSDLRSILSGVKTVWASLLSERSLIERARTGSQLGLHGPFGMAVPIQRLIPARHSAVAFNYDPRRGRDAILVESVPGFGDPLVKGSVTPDRWLFDLTGETLLEKHVAFHSTRLVCDGDTQRIEAIPPLERFTAGMSDAVASELARAVVKVGRQPSSAGYIDLECVHDGTSLYVVQERPQTALPPKGEPHRVAAAFSAEAAAPTFFTGGEAASLGAANGRLVMVSTPDSMNPEGDNLPLALRYTKPGDILVTETTNIGWTELFHRLCGVVSERGGVMSHTAITAREYGIPAIVGAQGAIAALKSFLRDAGECAFEADGRVLIFESGAIDATSRRLYAAPVEIRTVELEELRAATETGHAVRTDYYQNRTEFAHFTDVDGVRWTGKPEYALSPFQFAVYHRGWEKALSALGIGSEQLRVFVVTRAAAPAAERMIGSLEPFEGQSLQPDQHLVVAFKTDELATLGDFIRKNGIQSYRGEGRDSVLDQIYVYHERRKEAFARYSRLIEDARTQGELNGESLPAICDAYSEVISFAHVRAAFRRRVAGPLRDELIRSLPEQVRARCEQHILLYSDGLYTETSHARDPEYRLLSLALQREVSISSPPKWEELRRSFPALGEAIENHGHRFRALRGTDDRITNAPSPAELYESMLRSIALNPGEHELRPLFTRTPEGFRSRISELRTLIASHDPDFDFQRFERIMLLSWEVPAITDSERHIQYRTQQILRSLMLKLERRLRDSGRLERESSIFDLTPDRLLSLL